MAPDEVVLRKDLVSAGFLSGEDRGRWRLVELRFPVLLVSVKAKDEREFTLRLDCTGYPQSAPTGTVWDVARNAQLATHLWPRGGRVSEVFRPDWLGGQALYLPCDRASMAGHPNWVSQYPSLVWKPEDGIAQYLHVVHELLQSRDYERAKT